MYVRAAIGFCLILAGLGAWPCQAGEVRGKVTLQSELPPRKEGTRKVRLGYSKSDLPDPNDRGGLPTGARVNELENVVVYVEAASGTLSATPRTEGNKLPEMHQKNKEFEPHVLAIVRGSKVRFVNHDGIYHHIYSASVPMDFEIKRYKGKHAVESFPEPGVVEIFCGLHPRMNAYIFVVGSDSFRKPDATGAFRIPDLPPGEYLLKAWHPRLKPVEKKVRVPESGPVTADLVL